MILGVESTEKKKRKQTRLKIAVEGPERGNRFDR